MLTVLVAHSKEKNQKIIMMADSANAHRESKDSLTTRLNSERFTSGLARNRIFCTFPEHNNSSQDTTVYITNKPNKDELIKYIRRNVIGGHKTFTGPFGIRRVLYLDHVASGRALSFIEDYVRDMVLPEYGNTHTSTSVTSLQTSLFVHEARDIVRNAVNASEHDAVIFCGSGTTSAISKLIHCLQFTSPPVVFLGPFEHHSNMLPWRHIAAEVVTIKDNVYGLVDMQDLEHQLQIWSRQGRELIGCFSAASNITGLLTDTNSVTALLHSYGCKAFWDYASAAPYIEINMNPVCVGHAQALVSKDALYFSCHKFIGGVASSGILVVKKQLIRASIPEVPGGGTVFFVRRESERYLKDAEFREEGGTPDIVGNIRAGLVMQLKEAVGAHNIEQMEHNLSRKFLDALRDIPNLVLLGSTTVPRLPVFSFLIHHAPSGLFLHHNYVAALLNDLFGIQARGGCACAGPYALHLLGIDENLASIYEEVLAEDKQLDRVHLRRKGEHSDYEILRPGFTRINLPYFIAEEEITFLIHALSFISMHGWKFLPQYMFVPESGEWRATRHQVFKYRKWLSEISYKNGNMCYSNTSDDAAPSLQELLKLAEQELLRIQKMCFDLPDHTKMFSEAATSLLWFLLPSEAHRYIKDSITFQGNLLPFSPQSLIDDLINKYGVLGRLNLNYLKYFAVETQDNAIKQQNTVSNNLKAVPNSSQSVLSDDAPIADNVNPLLYMPEYPHQTRVEMCYKTHTASCSNCDTIIIAQKTEPDMSPTCGNKSKLLNELSCGWDSNKIPTNALEHIDDPTFNKLTTLSCDAPIVLANEDSDCSGITSDDICRTLPDISVSMVNRNQITTFSKSNNKYSVSSPSSYNRRNQNIINILDQKAPTAEQTLNMFDRRDADCQCSGLSQSSLSSEHHVLSYDKTLISSGDGKERLSPTTCVVSRSCCKVNGIPPPVLCHNKQAGPTGIWRSPDKKIFKPFLKAVHHYHMIKNGDHLLVCLSGGKDSLSLLHTVKQYQHYASDKGINFTFGAVTVDPDTPSYDPSTLIPYLSSLDVDYFYEKQAILEQASSLPYECDSICSFCSRMKRGRIYACARREGYNVIALGQHLDDLVESFMMSVFHNGILRTMKASYTVKEGDLRVIRPFVHVREKHLRQFAERNKLPVIRENCPACFEAPKERQRIKQLLAAQEILFPRIYCSLKKAISPIVSIDRTGVSFNDLHIYTEEED